MRSNSLTMKSSTLKLTITTIVIGIFLFLLCSCNTLDNTLEPLSKYKGSVLVDKLGKFSNLETSSYRVNIQYIENGEIKTVSTSEYDFNRYKLGDTIK